MFKLHKITLVVVVVLLCTAAASAAEDKPPRHYATFFTGLKCQLKTNYAANNFFNNHALDYPDMIVAEVAGEPRIKIFATEEDRDASVVDATKLSIAELTALLAKGVQKPKVVATIDLALISLPEIHAELKKYNVFR